MGRHTLNRRGSARDSQADSIDRLAGTLLTAAGALVEKRFVAQTRTQAAVDSITVIGAADLPVASGGYFTLMTGAQAITADAPLTAGDPVKVGTAGRATKHTTAQHTLQTTITGVASSFTQPGEATALEIVQAADVAGDRGRGIVIEGSDGAGLAITETITLNATNTTTAAAGSTSFTKISGVYTADGAVLGAQSLTIRATGAGATVCTFVNGTSQLGANIPAQSAQAYCNEVTITGPNSNSTFVTVVGVNSADAVARERVQLNGASPSVITTTAVFRTVTRLCLGEFTNAATGAAKTNVTTDTAGMKCGVVIGADVSARGDDAQVLIKPNA